MNFKMFKVFATKLLPDKAAAIAAMEETDINSFKQVLAWTSEPRVCVDDGTRFSFISLKTSASIQIYNIENHGKTFWDK